MLLLGAAAGRMGLTTIGHDSSPRSRSVQTAERRGAPEAR
jgi:hypothetical protein